MLRRFGLLFLLYVYAINAKLTLNNSTWQSMQNSTLQSKKIAKHANEEKANEMFFMTETGSHCNEDGFFADRDDCRKFHVCYGGTHSVRWCKNGMLWDETKIGCTPQSSISCVGGRKKWSSDEDTTTTTTTTTTVTVPVLTATNSQTNKSNYTCRPGATGFFADPSSCSIYHWCVLGILQSTHRCNAGLHFSSSSNSCLWPKDAECEGQIAPPYSSIACRLGIAGYFSDPYDCSVFHYCDGVKSQSESLLCASGLVWSPRLESCSWPHEVTECQNSCPTNFSSQMRFADPTVCSQYVQCVDGHLEQRICPRNLFFDRLTKTCKSHEDAECHGAKPDLNTESTTDSSSTSSTTPQHSDLTNGNKIQRSTRFSCIVDGYYGDSQDCRVYHVCVDGRDYRSVCAPGLAWENLLRLCMPMNLAGCQSSKSFEPPSGSANRQWYLPFTRGAVITIATTPTTTTTTTTTTLTTPSDSFALPTNFSCAGRPNGYYADPKYCQKFHYCATGWHSIMECDDNLAYSARDNDCVPIELAECGTTRILRKKH